MTVARVEGRAWDQVRPICVQFDLYGYAAASVLFELGNTKVLCSVDIQNGVPPFLRGKKSGWLKAEYAMLPASTTTRSARDSGCAKNGRTIEISRLIGRSLRAIVNLDLLGERTITIDCDVLQADGGTRTACLTAASLALNRAVAVWQSRGEVSSEFFQDQLAAISVGIKNSSLLLDLDYGEDASIDADFNFVLTKAGTIIEIQGAVERSSIDWEQFNAMSLLAIKGVKDIFTSIELLNAAAPLNKNLRQVNSNNKPESVPFFSLAGRTSFNKRSRDGSFDLS